MQTGYFAPVVDARESVKLAAANVVMPPVFNAGTVRVPVFDHDGAKVATLLPGESVERFDDGQGGFTYRVTPAGRAGDFRLIDVPIGIGIAVLMLSAILLAMWAQSYFPGP